MMKARLYYFIEEIFIFFLNNLSEYFVLVGTY